MRRLGSEGKHDPGDLAVYAIHLSPQSELGMQDPSAVVVTVLMSAVGVVAEL